MVPLSLTAIINRGQVPPHQGAQDGGPLAHPAMMPRHVPNTGCLSTSGLLRTLIPEGTQAHTFSEWVLRECDQHNTRPAANLLFAHYATHKTDLPLSDREVRVLVEDGGWATEEGVVEWLASIIEKLRLIRDEMMSRYGITTLDEDEVMS